VEYKEPGRPRRKDGEVRITGTRFHLVETPRETGAISEHLLVRVDTDEGLSGWGEWSDLALPAR
jgi:L-alanine-DL-glutamate epimerase-like enolase superfamily enzyme